MSKSPKHTSQFYAKYQLGTLIHENIVSFLYRGEVVSTQAPVFIWQYKPEFLAADLVSTLMYRAESIMALKHPNLMPLIDYVYDGDTLFCVYSTTKKVWPMELYLERHKSISESQIGNWGNELISGLTYLESQKECCGYFTYRHLFVDVSTHSIKMGHLVLPTLVISEWFDPLNVLEDNVFFPPEFLQRHTISSKGDMFSFGVWMYFLLTKSWPMSAQTTVSDAKKAVLHMSDDTLKNKLQAYPKWSSLIRRCLARDPQSRFDSFSQLSDTAYHSAQGNADHVPSGDKQLDTEMQSDLFVEESVQRLQKRRLLLSIMAVVAIMLSLYVGYQSYFSNMPTVEVPPIIGLHQDEAVTILQNKRLRSVVYATQHHPTIAKGGVIDVKPREGRDVRENREIRLWVSDGPRKIAMPDVRGRLLDRVQILLDSEMTVKIRGDQYSRKYPSGTVISQSPGPNQYVQPNKTVVELIISKGFPLTVQTVSRENDYSRIGIRCWVPDRWDQERVSVKTIANGEDWELFNDQIDPGEERYIELKVPSSQLMEIYFGDDLAYSQVIQ